MKAAIIAVEYTVTVEYDIEEMEKALGIKWADVEDYGSKWGFLILEMRNGDAHRVVVDLDDKLCKVGYWREPFKHACRHTVYTEDYDEVDSRNR